METLTLIHADIKSIFLVKRKLTNNNKRIICTLIQQYLTAYAFILFLLHLSTIVTN